MKLYLVIGRVEFTENSHGFYAAVSPEAASKLFANDLRGNYTPDERREMRESEKLIYIDYVIEVDTANAVASENESMNF